MSFQNLGLSPSVLQATKDFGYQKPFPIQEKVIPAILKGKDVMGIAPTGSGKTASFVFPLVSILEAQKIERTRNVQVLVLVPTRELAAQIQEVVHQTTTWSKRNIGSMAVFGGVSINPQMKNMYGTEILVATPGRLIELLDRKALSLHELKHLVIDEADKLFQLGFEEELATIIKQLPAKKQVTLFSATLNEKVQEIQSKLNIQPEIIEVVPDAVDISKIDQKAYHITAAMKGPFLRYIIKSQNLNKVLVFVSSQRTADNLVEKLRKNKISAMSIHGKKAQGTRMDNLDDFKNGKVQVLVATDLIGRGIHIDALPVVINYELPRSPLDYVHRIGRTGRAHESGIAYTLLTDEDLHHFKIIQKKMGIQVPIENSMEVSLHGY